MPTLTRRRLLTAAGAVATAAVVPTPAAAADLSDWLADVDGADTVVDRTGTSKVTVRVGAEGNGGAFAFGPPVVRVDPGTTVVWTWTGEGGSHNVVAESGAFESESSAAADTTFEYTAEGEGVIRYACTPHQGLGMKGAVVVGDVSVRLPGESATPSPTPTDTASDSTTTQSPDGTATRSGETPGTPESPFGGWLRGTGATLVDRTGRDVVRVAVGSAGANGTGGFVPAAVRVSPGTTVVWEWMRDGTTYRVAATNGGFDSGASAQVGHRYAVRFTGEGVWRYASDADGPDARGVVVVGYPDGRDPVAGPLGALGGSVGLLALLYGGARVLDRFHPDAADTPVADDPVPDSHRRTSTRWWQRGRSG